MARGYRRRYSPRPLGTHARLGKRIPGYTRPPGTGRRLIGFRRQFIVGTDRTGGYYGRYANGGELKFHDVSPGDSPTVTAGIITTSLNLIAQGTTEKTRIGRKCVIKSINWHWNITLPPSTAAADAGDNVRVMLILDKQANGAVPVVLDILELEQYQEFRNLANSGRFQVLYDRTYPVLASAGSGRGSTDTLSYGEGHLVGTFYKKCNIPIEFSGVTGAITEIRSNNLIALFISESGKATFGSRMRLRFSDA